MADCERTSGRIQRTRFNIVRAKKPRVQGATAASSTSIIGFGEVSCSRNFSSFN
jgi:hypothetical protein